MNNAKVLLLLGICLTQISCIQKRATNHKLHLINAYEVVTHGEIEPSGLTLWDGVFYTVSDKADIIYRLDFKGKKVELFPLILLNNDKGGKLDFEGITHDNDNFYLVSELHFQILKVSRDGSQQTWLPTTNLLKDRGESVGLFKTRNANFEGICFLGNHQFLLAAERQPRGFVHYDSESKDTIAYQRDDAVFEYKQGRSPDFTGLSCDSGMYVLDRNAYTVAELIKRDGKYTERKGYSYAHIINQSQLQYQDMKYGHAEGLVVKNNKVFIILDNNRNPRVDSNNSNSLFIEMVVR